MKIVILSNRDLKGGGAYMAALRLTRALREEGMDAVMLVKEKQSDETFVHSMTHSNLWQRFKAFVKEYGERLYLFTQIKLKKNRFNFSLGRWGLPVERHPLVQNADIVHLHWINKAFVSLDSIRKIGESGKKLVWTMHDMWSFTGGCHYSGDCEKYLSSCESCPLLSSPGPNDHSRIVWLKKKSLIESVHIEGVTCSTWLEDAARKSRLWPNDRIRTINNAIDTTFFAPVSQSEQGKKRTVLFIARDIHEHRKGLDLLFLALKKVIEDRPDLKDKAHLILAGEFKEKQDFPISVTYAGFMSNMHEIREVYLKADILALPSREDNLPNTLVEASACGLASIAFSVGGIPEMIDHESTGLLIQPESVEQLASGLTTLFECSNEELDNYKRAARELALKKYSPGAVAKKYGGVYSSLI